MRSNNIIFGDMVMDILKPKYWHKNSSLKTVDIITLEWFDNINGNSYFASVVTVNHGLKNEFCFTNKFQYGYGSQSYYVAIQTLIEAGIVSEDDSISIRRKTNHKINRTTKKLVKSV